MIPSKKLLISALLALCFGVLRADEFNPYPRISKQFAKGNYQKGLDLIKNTLPNSRYEERLWLYSMQIKGYLKLFEKDNRHQNVKRAVITAKYLNRKSKGPLPDYSLSALEELRSFILNYSGRFAVHNIQAQTTLIECIEPILEVYPDKDMAWLVFGFLSKTDSERALKILGDAVQKNYESRLKGDTTDFYYGYLPLMKHYAGRARFSSFLTMYRMARNAYSQYDSICIDATEILYSTARDMGLHQPYTQAVLTDIIDTMRQSGCVVLPLELLFKKEIFRYHCEVRPNFKEAFLAAQKLSTLAPDSCGSEYFRFEFTKNLLQNFRKADSIRWAVWMKMEGVKGEVRMLEMAELQINNWLNTKEVSKAGAFYQFIKTRFPAEKKINSRIREAISKSVKGHYDNIASGAAGLKTIEDFYSQNSDLPGTRELTITKLLKMGNDMRGLLDFSQCMRISKVALRLFPGEKRLMEEKLRWMILDYKNNYQDLSAYFEAEVKDFDAYLCKEGYVTDADQQKFIRVLDLVRRFAGVIDSCELDPEKNKECQKAALIMDANSTLTHHPSSTSKCYTKEGYEGASSSNLSLGHNGINALFGQLEDWGANNRSVGHRRWILNPHNNCFGHGSTERSMALGVMGTHCSRSDKNTATVFTDSTDFVAWPTKDYFPEQWLPFRWSFGFSGALFDSTKISVYQNGIKIPISINKLVYGYAINTIVWEIDSDDLKAGSPIYVKINNVEVRGKKRDFYYQITLF